MRFKNLFNIFLILALVSVGVYFVVSVGETTITVSSPTSNQYISGNFTFTIGSFNSSYTNVSTIVIYNVTGGFGGLNHTNVIRNYSGNQLTSLSISINTNTNFTNDGNYTFTFQIVNDSVNASNRAIYSESTVNISFIVDNTPPTSLILISPLNQTFIDNGTIQFGFIVKDSMSGNRTWGNPMNCTLSVNGTVNYVNRSVVVDNMTRIIPVDVNNFDNASWFNVSSTNFDSGYHVWNISCVDYNNNVNSSLSMPLGFNSHYRFGGNFTLTDNIAPTTSTPTFSASSVKEGNSVTVTCTGTDTITANPIEYVSVKSPTGSWQEGIGTSPYTFTGTNDVGTYTSKCYSIDTAGRQGGNSAEATFAVTRTTTSSTTSTGGGGGGGTVSVSVLTGQTRDLGAIAEGGEGIINAYQASTVTFTVTTSGGGATISSHSIEFDEVNYIEGTATVIISSDPITLTLNVGDVKNVDLDNDGTDDLEVNLVSIDENGKVNLKIKDVTGAVTAEEEAGEEVTPTTEEAKAGVSWIWWILIVIVVVVIIALILPKKK